MKVDLTGKIKSTQLPRSKALLPMFEAVVNSFQAIEDDRGNTLSPSIDIVVEREHVLENLEVDGEVKGFVIVDDGVGFSPANLDSFFTEYTRRSPSVVVFLLPHAEWCVKWGRGIPIQKTPPNPLL